MLISGLEHDVCECGQGPQEHEATFSTIVRRSGYLVCLWVLSNSVEQFLDPVDVLDKQQIECSRESCQAFAFEYVEFVKVN